MADAQILLLSSSKAGDSDYLAPCIKPINEHCGQRRILFIPYAGVGFSNATYTDRVRAALAPAGIDVYGIESELDPVTAINQAEAIMVGGGNTFQLLAKLYDHKLIAPIQAAVNAGVPYVGWSAGSNIAGLSIRTTNDMPIIEPPSFNALQLVPVQLNPHYTDYQPPGFHGETRDQRLGEFMAIAPKTPIIAIPEGSYLRINGAQMHYYGEAPGYVFLGGDKQPLQPEQDCSQWL
ncbi:dipeptidase PepE [Pseudidiomarina andamanensis]|uniref:Dipeptidase PepE n=1 Tax=Pseudidiomarina andamanensis TaxID=1940690 RepID=A0AA92EV28_9GAMM|nr:dipeptidase PepE [Pseudidiomarina andamanensis]MDS0218283.1 dipeptidase PepE [Pseudidiomarina andamanensis]QGT95169.1 dipeptidase PepE [Pseudidiomarina andamanensis]